MVLLKLSLALGVTPNDLLSTFHYGSIKIDLEKLCYHAKFLSTFHYGSIKINIQFNHSLFQII